jgi:hypothetical protein
MPFLDELYIGTYSGGVNGMVKISSLGLGTYSPTIAEGAFTVDPIHYSQELQTAGGDVIDAGWLEAAWHVNGLRADQYDDIVAYSTGRTTPVYIRTLDNDGATYTNFLAKAIFPPRPIRADPTAVEDGAVFDFEIRFIQCIEQI